MPKISNMKIRYIGLTLALFICIFEQAFSQNKLQLAPDIFYSDTIATKDVFVNINLSLTNTSSTFYSDTPFVELAIGDDSAMIIFEDRVSLAPSSTFDSLITFIYPSTLRDRKAISLRISPRISTFIGDSVSTFLAIEYVTSGVVVPAIEQLSFPDTVRSSDTPYISFNFQNTGQIDYVHARSAQPIEIYAMVNNEDASKKARWNFE